MRRQQPRRARRRGLQRSAIALLVVAAGLWAVASRWRREVAPAEPPAALAVETSAAVAAGGDPQPPLPSEETLASERASLESAILASEPLEAELAETHRVRFGPPDPFDTIAAEVARGQTLIQTLTDAGMPRDEANRVVVSLSEHFNFRGLRPGDRFEGTLWLGESLLSGTLFHGRLERYRVERDDDGLKSWRDPVRLTPVTDHVSGEIRSSLFEAIYAAGEKPNLIMAFVELFSWDFDFNVSTRAGDRFQMQVEKRYAGDEFYDYGPILAARYRSGDQNYEACWFTDERDGTHDGYYHPDGTSVKGAFLRAPVKFTRISSRFTKSRLHPVLGIRRPHSGIDYAAPMGTPVYSVAGGVVLDAGWMGGAGNAVRIRHPNGWITSYSHLSKIGVKRGQTVRQAQWVGNVGSTGHSTGPHLDYRVKIGGNFVDPLKLDYPRGEPIPSALKTAFVDSCRDRLERLSEPLVATSRP